MFDRVILRVIQGELQGQTLVLENDMRYILGRSQDCSLHLPDPHLLVSRYHCWIKVSAPFVAIQDLGSLNGTYINGGRIDQGDREQPLAEGRLVKHAEYLLWDGDQLRIGDNVFQVEFDPPAPCAADEPRDQEKLWSCDCSLC
jgi:eukaryotic-like serine/threonine-protein kinase